MQKINYEADSLIGNQDGLHILLKLFNAFIRTKTSFRLPRANFRRSDLESLANFSKEVNFSLKNLAKNNFMNYAGAQRVISADTEKALSTLKYDSCMVGAALIRMGCWATEPYLCGDDGSVSEVSKKIVNLFASVYFIRAWRFWLTSNKISLKTSTFTLNAAAGIELNAYAIINIIRKVRETSHPFFSFSCLGSQSCENFFRRMRSLSPYNSTIINFDFAEGIRRIAAIQEIMVFFLSLQKN